MIPSRDLIDLWERRRDPTVAAAMLAIVEKYRSVGKPLPSLLARWHSQAIARMLNATPRVGQKTEHARWGEYGRALGMVKSDSRPIKFISRYFVVMAIVNLESNYSEIKVCELVEREYGVCRNTAVKSVRSAKALIDEARRFTPITEGLDDRTNPD